MDFGLGGIVIWIVFLVLIVLIVILVLSYWNQPRQEDVPGENSAIDPDYIESLRRKHAPGKRQLLLEKDINPRLPRGNYYAGDSTAKNSPERSRMKYYARLYRLIKDDPKFIEEIQLAQQKMLECKLVRYYDIWRGISVKSVNGNAGSLEDPDIVMKKAALESMELIKRKLDTPTSREEIRRRLMEIFVNPERGFCSLIGRWELKEFICHKILSFAANPGIFVDGFQHIILAGPPGIGKTKTAEIIAYAFYKSGICARKFSSTKTAKDLVSPYVNQSSRETYCLLARHFEGVLLIDEAYELAVKRDLMGGLRNHNSEAIGELVNFIDKHIGCNIIVAAGYQDRMLEDFIGSNEGMNRRFPHKLILGDYTTLELAKLLIVILHKDSSQLTEDIHDYLYLIITRLNQHHPQVLANQAGFIKNLGDAIRGDLMQLGDISNVPVGNLQRVIFDSVETYLKNSGFDEVNLREILLN